MTFEEWSYFMHALGTTKVLTRSGRSFDGAKAQPDSDFALLA